MNGFTTFSFGLAPTTNEHHNKGAKNNTHRHHKCKKKTQDKDSDIMTS
jgi:hypothetical protein